jgi:serine/threonine-protein kinase
MEWLEGPTLEEQLRARGRFPVREAVELVLGLCSAVRAIHEASVVHRDLKPSNLMKAGPRGQLKLIDFGVAKMVSAEETCGHERVGTPCYMAPEQILGEPVTGRTDVYALGVILFELITGTTPFRGASVPELQMMHLHDPPPRVSQHVEVPAAIDGIVARCLSKRRRERARLEELVASLQAVLALT